MKLFKNVSGVFALALLLLVFNSCSSFKELKIGNVRNVEIKGISNNVVTLEFTIPIENPNTFGLTVCGADLKVFTSKKELGKVKQMSDIDISGKSAKLYTVRVAIELTNIGNSFSSMLELYSLKTMDIAMSGTVKIKSLFYRKTLDINNIKLN
jgi:LEA14-like dessication related protein